MVVNRPQPIALAIRPQATLRSPEPVASGASSSLQAYASQHQVAQYQYTPYHPYPVRQEPTLGRVASWGLGAWGALRLVANTFASSPQGFAALGVVALGAWGGNRVYDWLRSQGAF